MVDFVKRSELVIGIMFKRDISIDDLITEIKFLQSIPRKERCKIDISRLELLRNKLKESYE